VLPAVFAFLPNKTTSTYQRLFTILRNNLPLNFAPHSLITGFLLPYLFQAPCCLSTFAFPFFCEKLQLMKVSPSDFEVGEIKAFSMVFGQNVAVHACLFHLQHCVWRHMQKLKLQDAYKSIDTASRVLGLSALSMLPPALVRRGFQLLFNDMMTNCHVLRSSCNN
jgi:hypothetical protein